MNISKTLLILFVLSLTSLYSFGQDKDSVTSKTASPKEKKKKKVRIVPLPIIYYSPITSFGFGALSAINFDLGKDSTTRSSYVQPYVLYTLNKQYEFTVKHSVFTNDERFAFTGRYTFNYFPQSYYGIGNDMDSSHYERVEFNRLYFEQRVTRQAKKGVFVGGQYRFCNMYNLEIPENGLLDSTMTSGYQGYLISGLGVVGVLDKRDNIVNPSKGYYAELSNYNYLKTLGSQINYSTLLVDLRKYFTIVPSKRHVLALQFYGSFTFRDAPFKELPELGTETVMRGYYRGRYRGHHLMALQAEYRMPVYKFFGLTFFASTASISNSEGKIEWGKFKPNYGIGLRFMINKRDKVNLRFDYGFADYGQSDAVLDITEAF